MIRYFSKKEVWPEFFNRGAKIIAVEIDRDLFSILAKKFSDKKNIEVLNEDALKIPYEDLVKRFEKRLKVVANLPYNISTPILFKFLDSKDVFTTLILMLQKEVAQRLAAKPSCKDYGVLSIFVQMFMDVEIGFMVPNSAFYPTPNIDSAVVRFDVLNEPRAKIEDIGIFKRLVRAAFGQRRKTLSNALKSLNIAQENISKAFELANIDAKRRGETLSIEEFARLSNFIYRAS
ncbi:MAG: ribosomal RNA small subunit methyltransferase A [Deltaproteobacteria bacterium]|nr:ribosomal RNA small subunit methyltransferase A [Deltaproteobacteria bacterium]